MMKEDVGDIDFPIWLVADSNPGQWESKLETPLDPRHPVRHNIWTAVLDVVQDRVYRTSRLRVDASRVYMRNAVQDATVKPKPTLLAWTGPIEEEICRLRGLVEGHKPALLFSFGAFSFEFMRRATCEEVLRKYGHWGARELGAEFRSRMGALAPGRTNLIPLLHRSISGGKFMESHEYFCGVLGANYFDVVGSTIADKLLEYQEQLPIWIS